jgi:putative oxidoreductase
MFMKKLFFGGQELTSLFAEVGTTVLRIFAGVSLMMAHRLGKMPPSEQFIGFVAKIGFPLPIVFAWSASFAEFLGGAFLAIGFLTRPASFFILFTMAVAFFGVHWHDPYQKKELALLYGFLALNFLFVGSGSLSIDALARRKLGRS